MNNRRYFLLNVSGSNPWIPPINIITITIIINAVFIIIIVVIIIIIIVIINIIIITIIIIITAIIIIIIFFFNFYRSLLRWWWTKVSNTKHLTGFELVFSRFNFQRHACFFQ